MEVHTLFHAPGASFPLEKWHNVADIEVSEHVFKKIVGLDSVDGMWIATEVDIPWQNASLDDVPLHRLLALEGVQVSCPST